MNNETPAYKISRSNAVYFLRSFELNIQQSYTDWARKDLLSRELQYEGLFLHCYLLRITFVYENIVYVSI